MAEVRIGGIRLNRVIDARVELRRNGGGQPAPQWSEPASYRFVVTLPLDADTTIEEWALDQTDPGRFREVTIGIQDRSKAVVQVWRAPRAFVSAYDQIEDVPHEDRVSHRRLVIEAIASGGQPALVVQSAPAEPGAA